MTFGMSSEHPMNILISSFAFCKSVVHSQKKIYHNLQPVIDKTEVAPKVFYKKAGVLKIFAKFTGKHLC